MNRLKAMKRQFLRYQGRMFGALILFVLVNLVSSCVDLIVETGQVRTFSYPLLAAAQSPLGDVPQSVIKFRIQLAGVLIGAAVLLVAVIYVYLKLELITRGFYSGRIQVAAAVAAILIVAGTYFVCITLATS